MFVNRRLTMKQCFVCGAHQHPEVNMLTVSASVDGGKVFNVAVCSCCIERINSMTLGQRLLLAELVGKLPTREELEVGL